MKANLEIFSDDFNVLRDIYEYPSPLLNILIGNKNIINNELHIRKYSVDFISESKKYHINAELNTESI